MCSVAIKERSPSAGKNRDYTQVYYTLHRLPSSQRDTQAHTQPATFQRRKVDEETLRQHLQNGQEQRLSC